MSWFNRSYGKSADVPEELLTQIEFEQLLAGSGPVLEAFCLRAGPVLRGVVQRVLAERDRRDPALVEDLVHDLVVEFLRDDKLALKKWDPSRGTLRVFLRMVANRRTRDRLRGSSYRRSREQTLDDAKEVQSAATVQAPELGAEAQDFWLRFKGLFEVHATAPEQELYRRFYANEEKPEEIAASLQVSPEALYKRLSRLRKRLFELRDRLLDEQAKERPHA